MRYEIVAETYRDLESATGRLQLIERLAAAVCLGRIFISGCAALSRLSLHV